MQIKKRTSAAAPSVRRPLWVGLVLALSLGLAFRTSLEEGVERAVRLIQGRVLLLAQPRSADVPVIVLDVDHLSMRKLAWVRERALRVGILVTGNDEEVPATIRTGDEEARARIRLKGDWTDHLDTDKWSLRVKVRGGKSILGYREFSLQHPKVRGYLSEWLFREFLRKQDILAPRISFARVVLNGADRGLYLVEEHFDKVLVESAGYREGPILKFSEDALWAEWAQLLPDFADSLSNYRHADESPIEPFNVSATFENPALRGSFEEGAGLLEGFRRGELPADRVFDVGKMATFWASCDLFGARHAENWHNLRFYFDPLRHRLQPVAFDGDAGELTPTLALNTSSGPVGKRLLADRVFIAAYLTELRRLSQATTLEAFRVEARSSLERLEALLRTEFPSYRLDQAFLDRNSRVIASAVTPPRLSNAYLRAVSGDRVEISVSSAQVFPIVISAAVTEDGRRLELPDPVLLPGMPERGSHPMEILTIPLRQALPASDPAVRLDLDVHLPGQPGLLEPVVPWPLPSPPPTNVFSASPNPDRFPFLAVDSTSRRIRILRGDWNVTEDLVLPPGFVVEGGPDTRITIAPGRWVLSRSPLHLEGAPGAPFVVAGEGGRLFLDSREPSTWRRVRIEGLGALPTMPRSAGVTALEARLDLDEVEFVGCRGEDALNVVRSQFSIRRSLFSRAEGDALDSDFSVGSIEDTAFVESGNDALDFSGSRVSIRDLRIDGAGDKGISAGERSQVDLKGASIRGALCGAASKDLSSLRLADVSIRDSECGLAGYQKKPEFGPASLFAERVVFENVRAEVLTDDRSIVEIDGARVDPDENDDLLRRVQGVE